MHVHSSLFMTIYDLFTNTILTLHFATYNQLQSSKQMRFMQNSLCKNTFCSFRKKQLLNEKTSHFISSNNSAVNPSVNDTNENSFLQTLYKNYAFLQFRVIRIHFYPIQIKQKEKTRWVCFKAIYQILQIKQLT